MFSPQKNLFITVKKETFIFFSISRHYILLTKWTQIYHKHQTIPSCNQCLDKWSFHQAMEVFECFFRVLFWIFLLHTTLLYVLNAHNPMQCLMFINLGKTQIFCCSWLCPASFTWVCCCYPTIDNDNETKDEVLPHGVCKTQYYLLLLTLYHI